MKKFLSLALVLLTAATAQAATGSEQQPLSVAQLIEQGVPAEPVADTYVQGYIVGCLDKVFGVYQPKWDVPSAPVTNMLLADAADVRDIARCITVQLPKGDIRTALSPYEIGNLGRKVIVRGINDKYLEYNGLKSTDWYKYVTEGGGGEDPVVPDDAVSIFNSLNEDEWTMDPYWNEEVVSMPSSMTYVWHWKSRDGRNFMNGSAFINDTDNAAESYLVSRSAFNLTGYKSIKATFEHAAKFQTTLRQLCGFYVREPGSAEWEKVEIPVWPDAGTWNFASSGDIDLSAYTGKTIQVAFLYKSTEQGADTWEIKNLKISGVPDGRELKDAGLVWPVAEATAVIGEDFDSPVLQFATTAPIRYTSSDPSIASVNTSGKISVFEEGTVTITAACDANGEYKGGEASYILHVEQPAEQEVMFRLLLDYDGTECDWTFENKHLADGLSYVWSWRTLDRDGSHYLNGSAYVGGNVFEAVSYAISPVIDLSGYRDIKVSFEHAAKFQTNLASLSSFLIREEGAQEWTRLHIANWPEPGSWAFTNSGKADISDFDGKRVQLAFQYGSNEYKADTWEIRNVRLYGYANQQGGIDDIESDSEAPVRYYDLSGRLVSGTPTAGLYLRVQGSHVEKVAVK